MDLLGEGSSKYNILLAQELMHFINKKLRGFNLAINLDMNKAYDTLNWHALIRLRGS